MKQKPIIPLFHYSPAKSRNFVVTDNLTLASGRYQGLQVRANQIDFLPALIDKLNMAAFDRKLGIV